MIPFVPCTKIDWVSVCLNNMLFVVSSIESIAYEENHMFELRTLGCPSLKRAFRTIVSAFGTFVSHLLLTVDITCFALLVTQVCTISNTLDIVIWGKMRGDGPAFCQPL